MKLRPNLLSLAALAVVLSACQITGVGPFPGAVLREATQSDPSGQTVLYEGSLRDTESFVIAVRVPSNLTTVDGRPAALYVEATGEVEMLVHDWNGTPLAESASKWIFTPPPRRSSALGAHLSTQAVAITYNCVGPCAILPAQAQTYYVRLRNTTGSTINYEFYAYTRQFDDLNEPGNNTRDGRVDFNTTESGAIETLGDEDWFRVQRSGTLSLTLQSGTLLFIRADLYRAGETTPYTTLADGQSRSVVAGDIIRVYEEDGSAGPSNSSMYNLRIQ
jgi:hypothetical protein